ncbi:hypothetical protein NOR_07514 [Metarhizium rileyi]|uniref:Uncharacterized protein n=1 Tax=Metarhizium rileyi (strain RCEF 4871) TaxID=1649241 RepID=A0A166S651_METRR|nr:hypothetical protein NOR_07514 [Metarhizium rileyi RCEF 4871]
MDPSSRDSLLNMIKKVARYRSSARFLYRTAKRFPLAQAMKAIPVALPKVAFQIQKCDQIYSLDSYLRRIGTFHGKGKNLGQFCRLLQTSEQQAGDEFVKQSKKTLLEAKIHAEIQLIFHCEREKYIPFPRVISSSKDACFLCNAFIHMHGKFHTPRSHGRLYPGWRLPMLPEAAIFEQRFVQYLQSYARDSIKVVLSRRKKTTYPNPNESTVLTIPNTPSSLSCGCSSSKYSDIAVNQMPAMVSAPVVPQAIDADGGDSQFAFDDGCQCSQKQTCSAPSSNGRRSAVSSSKTMAECSTGKGTCIKPKHGSISHGEREEPVNQLPIRLTGENLPFSRKITIHQQSFELACGNVMFLLEFDAVQAGRVSITKQKQDASDMRTSAAINVLDIPTNSEIKVECSRGASRFLVLLSPSVLLSFEFVWNAEEAIDMK